jgi:hypothetical protein
VTTLRTATCKGCGRPIVWAKNAEGKAIPLDPRAAVYRVREDSRGELHAERSNTDQDDQCWYFTTHFATCSHANEFSGSKSARESGAPSTEGGSAREGAGGTGGSGEPGKPAPKP